MKLLKIFPAFLFLLLLTSCNQNVNEPEVLDLNSEVSSLSKRVYNTSSVYSWPIRLTDCMGENIIISAPEMNIGYEGYSFRLVWNGGVLDGDYTHGSVSVYVNNQYRTSVSWTDPRYNPSYGWIGWVNFSYNNVPMKININKGSLADCSGLIVAAWTEPDQVQLQVEVIVPPDAPTGFNVTPTFNEDPNVKPTLSWNQTSDNDVTHVEIWRRNNQPVTAYSLIATVSKSNTSYTDNSVNWNLPIGRVFYYKIRFKDATHGLYSPYTPEKVTGSL
ncbi:MAG: hypothetical protein R6W90_15510 [Ignavibacteriaceae bacterium]